MDHLSHIRRESDAFLAAALDGGLDAPVAGCPGWSVVDLVGHLGVVQRFHGANLLRGVTDRPTHARPTPPETGLADWFREGADVLFANLATVGFDTPSWSWWIRPQDAVTRFWHRRMGCEAAIHRWDVQLARGQATGFDPELAVDGIDEVLAMQIPAKRVTAAAPGRPPRRARDRRRRTPVPRPPRSALCATRTRSVVTPRAHAGAPRSTSSATARDELNGAPVT